MSRNNRARHLTSQEREYFRKGLQLFYLNHPRDTLRRAYERTLVEFFRLGYEQWEGLLVPILPPCSELPTYDQFYYFYRKEYRPQIKLQKDMLNRKLETSVSPDLRSGATDLNDIPKWDWAVQQNVHSDELSIDLNLLKNEKP